MKKNISINISGIIFHIEEDGYEKLKEYLGSINKYFDTFDGSSEIIADIESRIAEIFLSKLNEGKQIITLEDVTALMATMGGIQDFQAVEEETTPFETSTEKEEEQEEEETSQSSTDERPKKLFRDKKRRLVGGVAAGIAHYFSIDPLWIRLIFIVLLFDFFITFALGGLVLVAYIVLWIVLPESDKLKEDKKLKKMYLNPQGRVIGGVANGVATYFGADIALIRVLFVLATFLGGTGLIAYIVLWIILPEAKSITDKVQMKGEAVTLENIESSIKKTQDTKEHPKEESKLVKVLLFPFRIIAIILGGLAKALGPIARFIIDSIRIILGVLLTIFGLAILFSVLIVGGVFLGLLAGSDMVHLGSFPLELINNTFSPFGFVAAMLVVGIPGLTVLFLGLSIAARTKIINATVGWAMFALWLLGIIGLSFTLPSLIYEFKDEGEYTQTNYYQIDSSQMVLDIKDIGYGDYDGVRLKLRGFDGEQIKLVQEFSSRGSTKREAMDNARSIEYNITQNDSLLIFDSSIDFSKETRFRGQDLLMTMYIPYGQTFIMQNNFDDLIYYSFGYQGFSSSQIIGNTWMFNPTGLECISCSNYSSSAEKRRENYEDLYSDNIRGRESDIIYEVEAFNKINISGPYRVNIVKGEEFRVVLNGSSSYIENSDVTVQDDELIINYEDEESDLHRYNRRVDVRIICPSIEELHLLEATTGSINGFEEDELYIKLDGASDMEIDVDVYAIDIKLSGAAQLSLTGKGKEVNIIMSTASYLNSYSYKAENVTIKASGASKARVYATDNLSIDASLVSEVKYRGGAKVSKTKSSKFSNVRED